LFAAVRAWIGRAGLCAALAACGGGSSIVSDPQTPSPPAAAAAGSIEGRIRSAADGSPLAGASVTAPGRTAVTTAADGSFRIADVTPGERVIVRVEAASHVAALAVVVVQAGAAASQSLAVLPAAPPQVIDPGVPSVVQDADSGARLAVPAGAFARSDTGAAPVGSLTVRLTSIHPAADAARMPGDYSTLVAGQVRAIESFGAVAVDVRDAAGNAYTLAPGQSASLRIPASSRAALPARVGLYSLDERSGRWVEEGSATLAGSGSLRWYEATVTHLSWWNADLPLETIIVRGCVRDAAGQPAAGRYVITDGLDYSGQALALSDAGGSFAVPMKRGGVAALAVQGGPARPPLPRTVGPSQGDINLPDCLQERSGAALAPSLLSQPQAMTAAAGSTVSFAALADGAQPLVSQWQRNGADLPGATGPVLRWFVRVEDAGAVFRVRVRNAQGEVFSDGAALTVQAEAATPPAITTQPVSATAASGAVVGFSVVAAGTAPLSYQWRRNGVALTGEVSATLSLTASAADDGARFSVLVSNSAGSVSSAEATLTVPAAPVGQAPQLLRQPDSFVGRPGDSVVFVVEASGTAPLAYQWLRNGQPLTGETGPRLNWVAREADNGALFTVVVSNSFGTVTSQPATLTVNLGTGISGTLTVSGDAQVLSGGSFVVNTASSLNGVNAAGPDCVANLSCLSTYSVVANEGIGFEAVSVVLISQVPPPGAVPGTSPTALSVGYSVADLAAQGSRLYGAACGLTGTPCGVNGIPGLSIDTATRRISFSNVSLALTTDASRVTVLNGVLRY
jgi:hypothetical protein